MSNELQSEQTPAGAALSANAAVASEKTAGEKATSEQAPATQPAAPVARGVRFVGGVAALALVLSTLLWLRLSSLQEQLARQSADTNVSATEARALARQAQEQEREMAARLATMEARLGEAALQRSQLEELMQSLSRSRDENLVVDIESSIRLAQQQAQLTGSVEPLLAALRTAEQRVLRVPQARLAPLQRALARDIARITATPLSGTPALLGHLDELARLADELPLANAVPFAASTRAPTPGKARSETASASWWEQAAQVLLSEARSLVRVSRIDNPESVLLTPEQSFFVRENYKLLLLNARLGLLARQPDAARADLGKAQAALQRYFDLNARTTRAAVALLQEAQAQMKTLELPRVDDTLAALATAAAGR